MEKTTESCYMGGNRIQLSECLKPEYVEKVPSKPALFYILFCRSLFGNSWR